MTIHLYKKAFFPFKQLIHVLYTEYLKSLCSIFLHLKNKNFLVSLHSKVERHHFKKQNKTSLPHYALVGQMGHSKKPTNP